MNRISLGLACLVAACVPHQAGRTGTGKPPTTESEWAAAADLATTLARAAGADRLSPAMRIREPGTVSRRHVTLAAAGCYHAGIAWLSSVDLDASIQVDPQATTTPAPATTTAAAASAAERHISAPGGALDFCLDHAGGAWLTLREVTEGHAASAPAIFEYAVVYGSAPVRKERRHTVARAR